jgi:hypothetical protein
MPRILKPALIGIAALAICLGLVTLGMNLTQYRQMVLPRCTAEASQFNGEIVMALANRSLGEAMETPAHTTCESRGGGSIYAYECVDPAISSHFAVVQLDTRDCSTLVAISRMEDLGRYSQP